MQITRSLRRVTGHASQFGFELNNSKTDVLNLFADVSLKTLSAGNLKPTVVESSLMQHSRVQVRHIMALLGRVKANTDPRRD